MAKPDFPPPATPPKLLSTVSTTVGANHINQAPDVSPQLLQQHNVRRHDQPDGQRQSMQQGEQQHEQQHEQYLAKRNLQQLPILERLSIESAPSGPSDRQPHRPVNQISASEGVSQPEQQPGRRGEDMPPLLRLSQRIHVEERLNNVIKATSFAIEDPGDVEIRNHAARTPLEIGDEETAREQRQSSEADMKPQIPAPDRQPPDLTSSQPEVKDADASHFACHTASTRTSASQLDLDETDTTYTPPNASSAGFSVLSYRYLEGAYQFSQNGDMDEEDDMWA